MFNTKYKKSIKYLEKTILEGHVFFINTWIQEYPNDKNIDYVIKMNNSNIEKKKIVRYILTHSPPKCKEINLNTMEYKSTEWYESRIKEAMFTDALILNFHHKYADYISPDLNRKYKEYFGIKTITNGTI